MSSLSIRGFNKYSIDFIVKLFLQREKIVRIDFEEASRVARDDLSRICVRLSIACDVRVGGNSNELNIYIERGCFVKNQFDARNNIVTVIIEATIEEYIENTLGICDNIYRFY